MTRLMKSLKWLACFLLILVGVVGIFWWVVPDEPLSAEAASFAAQPAVPPSARNASFMIWGLAASPELDPHAVGRRIVSAQDRIESAQKDARDFKPEHFLGAHPLILPKDIKPLCDAERYNCLQLYQTKAPDIEQELLARRLYLDRYLRIRTYEEFVSANSKISETTAIPNWRPVLRMAELINASIALDMRSKAKQQAALTELAAEITSWRRILTANDWVITQMIAVVALYRNYRLASEIMNAYPEVVVAYPELMQTITAPIPAADAFLAAALKTEGRVVMQHLWDMSLEQQLPDRWTFGRSRTELIEPIAIRLAYQPHASINEAFAVFTDVIAQATKSPKEFLDDDAAFKARLAEKTKFRVRDIFYNFAGRFDMSASLPDFNKYVYRMHDLVGLSRLAELQRRLLAAKVPSDKVADYLRNAGQNLVDPYTEKPMQWDGVSKVLSFVPQSKRFANFGLVNVATNP